MKPLRLLPVTLLLSLTVGIMSSCGGTPDGIIPPDKMARLMADIYVGEATMETSSHLFSSDSSRRVFKQSIFLKHGVTSEKVDTSLYWYGRHIDKYMKVCEETEKILQGRIAEAERNGATTSTALKATSLDGDSVNLWNGPSMRRITKDTPSDYITFSIPRDKNWERGDRFTLKSRGVLTQNPAHIMLGVDYTDGTSEYVYLNSSIDEQSARLTLTLDSAKTGSSVYGFIRYKASPDEVSYIDSISVVRTRGQNNNREARQGQHSTRFR